MKKSRKEFREDHDPKTCFRCRLHELWDELNNRHGNEPRFILMSMAEASGSILSQLDMDDVIMFMMAVQKFAHEDSNYESETKH